MKSLKRVAAQTKEISGRVFIRTTVFTACVLVALSFLHGVASIHERVSEFQRQLGDAAKHHARMLSVLGREAIASSNVFEVRRLVIGIREDADIIDVDVFDANGESFLLPGAATAMPRDAVKTVLSSAEPILLDAPDHMIWMAPVMRLDKVVGVIGIDMGKELLKEQTLSIIWKTVVNTVLALLFFLPLSAYLLHRSTRGISRVTTAANEAAQGFLGFDLEVDGQGEVRELQEAFQAMAKSLRATIQRVEHMANVDHVTFLPNRLNFGNISTKLIDQRAHATGAILLLDLDRFKRINDMHGHETGDRLLRLVASRLEETLKRMTDKGLETKPFLSRWSGDEFVVLLPGICDRELLLVLGEDLLSELRLPYRVDGHEFKIRASVGIAVYPDHAHSSDGAVRAADMAMFRAKEIGRDQAVIYDAAIRTQAEQKERIEKNLRDALSKNEFEVYYQPKIDLSTDEIVGSEALLRWKNEELGMVPPFKFIPIAEEIGLMSSIGEFVMMRSLDDMLALRREGHAQSIAINVSPIQFAGDFFTDRTLGLLGESGFPLDRIELEITESSLGGTPDQIRQLMMPLKEEGVSFAIDDFGTGISNLGMLTMLPFDTLKIDRSFVMNIADNDNRRQMVQIILLLAQQLSMKTVAEGIETELEKQYLKGWGTNLAQGYLWSPPVPFAEFRAKLQAQEVAFRGLRDASDCDVRSTG